MCDGTDVGDNSDEEYMKREKRRGEGMIAGEEYCDGPSA